MEPIYRILGKRGRTTIPYALRIALGFSPNDLVSFRREGDVVIVKREKVCTNCNTPDSAEGPVTSAALYSFLDTLPSSVRKEALVYLANHAN